VPINITFDELRERHSPLIDQMLALLCSPLTCVLHALPFRAPIGATWPRVAARGRASFSTWVDSWRRVARTRAAVVAGHRRLARHRRYATASLLLGAQLAFRSATVERLSEEVTTLQEDLSAEKAVLRTLIVEHRIEMH